MTKSFFLLSILLLAFTSHSSAQESLILNKGSWNVGVWTGGGSGVSGTTADTQLWLTGARIGKVLTGDLGKGIFRGRLEYAVEAIPAFFVFQDSTVYGFDVTPIILKWNFTSAHNRWIPYFEAGAGMLLTSEDVPEKTFPFNFTPQAGFGFHIMTGQRQAFTLTLKYMHISNGGLDSPNPGINSVQMFVGYHWFR
ncbi:acyloxyacyl hydrolase [bacterium]|nr:acyloxyacyl hydrolase [bacterium]